MEASLLPMGDSAVLVEVADTDAALALHAALRAAVAGRGPYEPVWVAVDELVPGARTVLVLSRDRAALDAVGRACLGVAAATTGSASTRRPTEVVEVPVVYDGPDLDEVARLTGLTRDEVVRAHTGSDWHVGFGGFAPGFAYLVGGDPRLRVPRRAAPRTRVPSGSVALAGEFSGIYPQDSPGGWQLVGSTDLVLWDADRQPPALLTPGTMVRFVEVTGDAAVTTRPLDGERGGDALVTTRPLDGGGARPSPSSGPAITPIRALEVLGTGPLTLVEDLGRPGLADVGVPRSGAADRAAYLLGLRLVGHLLHDERREGAPASLEVVLGGLSVRAHGDLVVALTGAPSPAEVDGRPAPHASPFHVRDGEVLALGTPVSGLRSYLAVRGGVEVPAVLGSRSSDTLSGVGPPTVVVGDVLPVGMPPRDFPLVDIAPVPTVAGRTAVLSMTRGPRADWCDLDDVTTRPWTVSSNSNRAGIRLEGKPIRRRAHREGAELPSEGMVPGAIQVPSGGEPVVFLADHPVTGGYPVVAVLTSESVDRAAQLRPGDEVSLRWV